MVDTTMPGRNHTRVCPERSYDSVLYSQSTCPSLFVVCETQHGTRIILSTPPPQPKHLHSHRPDVGVFAMSGILKLLVLTCVEQGPMMLVCPAYDMTDLAVVLEMLAGLCCNESSHHRGFEDHFPASSLIEVISLRAKFDTLCWCV